MTPAPVLTAIIYFLHGETIIRIFPLLGIVKLRYSVILAIYPVLFSDYQNNQCRHRLKVLTNRQNEKISPHCKMKYRNNS